MVAAAQKIPFFISYDDIELDNLCGMRYWLARHEAGQGISKVDTIVKDVMTQEVHSDLRTLAQMEDISPATIQAAIDEILEPLSANDRQDQGRMELLYRRLGWLAAFALFIEPAIREQYDTIPMDEEIILARDPLWIVAKPDRILREKKTKEVSYREFLGMPPALSNRAWLQGWHYTMRLHVGMAAANENLTANDGRIAHGKIVGMGEGYFSGVDGRLVHPYVWGYRNRKTNEWAHTFKPLTEEEWKLEPVWTYPRGIVAWAQLCGKQVAEQQFQESPPVYLNPTLLQHWVSNRIHREREIQAYRGNSHLNPNLRVIHFPQRTSQCRPAHGEPCPFLTACWNPGVAAFPLSSPDYVPNVELAGVNEESVVAEVVA